MHFEVLVEDKSGRLALEVILEKILGSNSVEHSWKIFSYQGIGHIPRNLHAVPNPYRRLLLEHLPALLRAYGKSLPHPSVVIVVVDLDSRNCMVFKQELLDLLQVCHPRPSTLFRIAIEEGEAWLLGDRKAVEAAYPRAKISVLDNYTQDSMCGTWEILADAVHPGGSSGLKKLGYPEIGKAKCRWAQEIAPHMNVDRNQSVSFQVFCDGVRRFAGTK